MFSHCASGVKYSRRDGNLQWEGERVQVLGAVFCSQDSGAAIQAWLLTPRGSLAPCSLLVGDFSAFVHLPRACLSHPSCHRSHPGEILPSLCPQGPQRTCLDSCTNHSYLCAALLWWKTAEPTHLHRGPDPKIAAKGRGSTEGELWGPSAAFCSSANKRFPSCQAGLTGIIKKMCMT